MTRSIRLGRFARNSKVLPRERAYIRSRGSVQQGKSENDGLYGWDNEYGNYTSDVAGFNASKYLVSNQEFLEFRRRRWVPNRELLDSGRMELSPVQER